MAENNQGLDIDSLKRLNIDQMLSDASGNDYVSFYSLLCQKFPECNDENPTNESLILRLFAKLCSMMLDPKNPHAPFKPLWIIDDKRSYILSDFTQDELDFFTLALPDISNIKLRARIGDVLWTSQKKNIEYAKIAIESYLSIPIEEDAFLHDGYDMWRRGISLAKMLGSGFSEHITKARERLESVFLTLPHKETSWGPRLGRLLFELCDSPEKYKKVVEIFIDWGDTSLAQSHWYWARDFYEEALKWVKNFEPHNTEWISDITYKIGRSWEDEAENRNEGCMLSGLAYSDALKTYRDIPRAFRDQYNIDAKINTLHKKMTSSHQEMERELTHIESDAIDISKEVRAAQERLRGKDPVTALVYLANIAPRIRKSDLEKETEETIKNSPLFLMMSSNYYSADGRIVAHSPGLTEDQNSPESQATRNSYLMRIYEMQISILVVSCIRPALDIFNTEQLITEDDLISLCNNSSLIPRDRVIFWAKGLYYGFENKFIEAIHLLSPQIENFIRGILKANGVKTSTIDSAGIENESALGTLLKSEEAVKFIPEDFFFELKALLTVPPGPNLRNEIAHGLISEQEAQGNHAIYFWWFCLRLMINALPIDPQSLNLNSTHD